MQFTDVIGQGEVKDHLLGMVKKDKVPHAQLFLGMEGAGGLPLALAFAQYLNCEDQGETDSCGSCSSCLKSTRLQHPDIHYSYPVIKSEKKPPVSSDYAGEWIAQIGTNGYITEYEWLQSIKAENKLGNISVDECHHIIRTLYLKTYESPYKILILWKPESLGLIGNTLLKIIEEPPPSTVMILVAENQEEILPTILSRTQILKIPPLGDDELADALVAREGVAQNEARRLAFFANGSYSSALMLSKDGLNLYSKLWLEWLVNVMKPQPAELQKWIDEVASLGREKQKHFFDYCLHFLRETTLEQYSELTPRFLPDELPVMKSLKRYLHNVEQAARLTELFEEKSYHIERNAHAKITLMDMSIRMQKILKGLPEPIMDNGL